jgi:hypothetical protein
VHHMKQASTSVIAYVTKAVIKKLHVLNMENIFFGIADFGGYLMYSHLIVNLLYNIRVTDYF